jgi:D-alanine--poly(phosphoribitol) ligase subunit 1
MYYTNAAQIFADVVRSNPDGKALLWAANHYTSYAELDRCSNRIARWLLDRGVRKRNTVCICLDKCLITYATILACLKIGAPYFAIDPANPRSRTQTMLERCKPIVAFVGTSADREAFDCEIIAVEERTHHAAVLDGTSDAAIRLDWEIDGSDPAYVMFTSGSTGIPKGVTISQNNLVNFIHWSQNEFNTRTDDVFTNVNPIFFDNSVFDVYSSLFCGASLAPFDAAVMRSPQQIISRMDDLGCTVYFSVPSLLIYLQTLKLIRHDSFPSLRKIIFGGEGYSLPKLAELYHALGNRIGLYNVYGPTECTCICSVYRISDVDFVQLEGYPPLGRMIPNFSYRIMAEETREAAPGEAGELFLGGPCVGLGYFGNEEQSAKAFVQNPTHQRFSDRMYKTGDLVRYNADDGKIYFVGRADNQIKHQGYRIELGEIEHAMASLGGVEEAAVVYIPLGGVNRIMAVVASNEELDSTSLKKAVAAKIPKYMIPDKVVVTRVLPKNPNGKVDRKGIAAMLQQGEL